MSIRIVVSSRRALTLGVVLMAGLLITSDTFAQRGGGGRGGRGGGMMMGAGRAQLISGLLAMEEVQEELDLSEKQIEEVVAEAEQLNDDFRAEIRAMFQEGGGMDEGAMADLSKEFKEEEGAILEKLNKDQMTRLKQLNYQRMGTGMLMDDDARKELGITDDQAKDMEDAMTNMRESMQELFQDGDRETMRERMGELAAEMEETVMGLLTDDQKDANGRNERRGFRIPTTAPRRRRRSPQRLLGLVSHRFFGKTSRSSALAICWSGGYFFRHVRFAL